MTGPIAIPGVARCRTCGDQISEADIRRSATPAGAKSCANVSCSVDRNGPTGPNRSIGSSTGSRASAPGWLLASELARLRSWVVTADRALTHRLRCLTVARVRGSVPGASQLFAQLGKGERRLGRRTTRCSQGHPQDDDSHQCPAVAHSMPPLKLVGLRPSRSWRKSQRYSELVSNAGIAVRSVASVGFGYSGFQPQPVWKAK